MPHTPEEYHARYASFDAFADMEIVFDKERSLIDGLIRYGNKALASLEKTPLEKLVGNRFGNMDPKWIKCYERAALYGERLELMDYSRTDTCVKAICIPTYRGHCGCLLFDISELGFIRSGNAPDSVIGRYFGIDNDQT